jgi:REP element-mobilizing transposase RayT
MRSHTDPRRPLRLKGYDYSQPGAYFITICTHERIPLFGEIIAHQMRPNSYGMIVTAVWNELPDHYPNAALDAFIVMPNHIHGIIILGDEAGKRYPLPEIARGFKTFSARAINERRQTRTAPLWHRGYYEHVVRDEKALSGIREYIVNNPARWSDDPDNPAVRGHSLQGGFETRLYDPRL